MMTIPIRRLTPDDTEAFIAIRGRALDAEPLAFGASPADDSGLSPEVMRQRLDPTSALPTFGAFDPGLVGIAGLFRLDKVKTAHKVFLWGVYVEPTAQGEGLGRRLVETALTHARDLDGVSQVQLTVTARQTAAIRLYERLGFECWGTEPDALRWQGESVAEHHMVLHL